MLRDQKDAEEIKSQEKLPDRNRFSLQINKADSAGEVPLGQRQIRHKYNTLEEIEKEQEEDKQAAAALAINRMYITPKSISDYDAENSNPGLAHEKKGEEEEKGQPQQDRAHARK